MARQTSSAHSQAGISFPVFAHLLVLLETTTAKVITVLHYSIISMPFLYGCT